MACGSFDLFPAFFEKYNRNSFLICLPKIPSSLQCFKQFAVSKHRADFCKVPNCQYHLLIHDEAIDLSCSLLIWTAISHTKASIAYLPHSNITSHVLYKFKVSFSKNFYQLSICTDLSNIKSQQIRVSRKNDSYGKKSEQNGVSAGRVNLLFLDQIQQPIYCWKLVQFLNQKSAKNSCELSLIYITHSNNVRQETMWCLFQMVRKIRFCASQEISSIRVHCSIRHV